MSVHRGERRLTVQDLLRLHAAGERLPMVTCYDYTSARIVDRTSIPMVLVGDSLGMVVHGHDSTLPVTLDDMVRHTQMVVRGCDRPLVVSDLPFLTYADDATALHCAGRLMAEGGCGSVKLEGGRAVAPVVRRLVETGIPVMGHLGLTPQSVHQLGLRVQGKDAARAAELVRDALALQDAGAWAVVLELVPAPLAAAITERLDIPTIGIGAGPGCDGEVQVWHDVLGLYDEHVPRHTRRYATLADTAAEALERLATDVRSGEFPTAAQSSTMPDDVLAEALRRAGDLA
ncbi:3-methyl-2-oxobutanoate hydroxymethyltransferase [uncultured Arsenicicoccus sp.]|uniref:3-methyl-2-oxobutanoate hydroxymethyltransferase n=1 Tax=uncultured Arsenicicoccus sp. TaxID=491339 RepID=UPI00259466B6|nr:3-methyl-2-oxobutanoate hydroxymethyltransferase [uncultured Arsenicicoccus sp.]